MSDRQRAFGAAACSRYEGSSAVLEVLTAVVCHGKCSRELDALG